MPRLPFALLAIALFSPAAGALLAQSSDGPDILEVRAGTTTETPGWTPTRILHEPGTIYIAPQSLFSDEDIDSVEPLVRGGSLTLQVRLTAQAGERMVTATEDVDGAYLAIYLEGRLVNTPKVMGQLGPSPLFIALDVPPERISGLVDRIRARWPG